MSNSYDTSPDGMQPVQKKGMSTGVKVLLVLGIVFGCLGLLCCGGMVMVGMWAKGLVSEDPVVVAQVTDDIVGIDIPDQLKPAVSVDAKVPFSGQQLMRVTVHADEETGSALVLVGLGQMMVNQDQEEMRRSIDTQLQGQQVEGQEDIMIESSYIKELEINGERAEFKISKGTGRQTQTPRIQVVGVFQGKTGPVMLMFNGHADKFSEEQIIEMLESIEGAEVPPDAAEMPIPDEPVSN